MLQLKLCLGYFYSSWNRYLGLWLSWARYLFSLILSDSLWFSLMLSDSLLFSLILSDSLWFSLILSDSLWFSLILSNSLWFSLILVLILMLILTLILILILILILMLMLILICFSNSVWFFLILSDSHSRTVFVFRPKMLKTWGVFEGVMRIYCYLLRFGPVRFSAARNYCYLQHFGAFMRGSYVFYNTLEPSCADRTCFTTLWAPGGSVVTPCPHAPVVDSVSYLLTSIRTL